MKNQESPVLVLGANGFLGSHLTASLLKRGWKVRALDQKWNVSLWKPYLESGALEINEASIFDETALQKALQDVCMVFHFVSFSIPGSSPRFLRNEVQTTLQAMEMLLTAMVESGTPKIIFPSSGGTIYGETNSRPAGETDHLNPLSSYGLGKLLCEEMIRFHWRVHNIQYLILRGSNVYGAPRLHRFSQGIIDVFLERIMKGEELTVWGNPENVRDYIFIDDFIDALFALLGLDDGVSRIINIGSGEGVSVQAIIKAIGKVIGVEPGWRLDRQAFAGIPYNVLDISLLRSLVGWKAKYSLEDGIAEVWRRKRAASSGGFFFS